MQQISTLEDIPYVTLPEDYPSNPGPFLARMYQQHGIKLIVIDYLQLLNASSSRIENRQQEIAQISNGIKALAKELDVPDKDVWVHVYHNDLQHYSI